MNVTIAKLSASFWRRTAFGRTGPGLALLAVSLVGLRLLWIHIQRPAHLEANAAAYGSIRNFYGAARMNHDGSQFIYVATADDRGRAVFLCDALTGKKRQIIEDKHGVGIWNDDFDVQAGPWSPDDRYFLCVVSNRLMVCSADTNQERVIIEDKPFSEAAWLTAGRFAYVTDETSLCLAQKREDGQWERRIFLSRDLPITPLTAISSDTVAWLENGDVICRAIFSEDPPKADTVAATTKIAVPSADGLTLWLDASKLRQPDQAPVMGLPDLSRSRNDAVWNGRPPVFNGTNSPLALNGQGTIHFGWVDSATNGTGLKTRFRSGLTGSAPRSVFVVLRHEADRAMMVSMGDTSAHGALFGVEWSERLFLPTGWWADNYVDASSTNWNLLEVVYDGASQKGYLNGLLRCTSSATLNTVERGVEIGYRDGSDAKAADGDFAELLIYDRALNYAERKQVEAYLGGKWFGKKSLSSQSPLVWYDTGLDGLTGMAWSKETGVFLLNHMENGRDSVWRLDTASGTNASPIQVMEGKSLRNVQWAGPEKVVYVSQDMNLTELLLANLSGGGKSRLFKHGNFDWFSVTPDQKQVFLFGSISNQPAPVIWRYELASDALRPVISSADYLSMDAQAVSVTHSRMKLPGGDVTCTIYRPPNFDPRKKYPLVLGDTLITDPIYGEPFMTGMAACGACVAVVERPWWPVGIEQWAPNVQGLYEQLKNDPTVDTRRVYLFAASAETHYLSQLVEANPAPWRGLILLNPGALPDFSKSPRFQLRPKILLDAGGEEHDEDRFRKYQTEALNSGVVVEFFTHPGETHRMVGSAAKLERARLLAHFIFEE